MENYLGETVVEQKDTKFKDYEKSDWVFYFLTKYGGIDGAHHKDWVLDQMARLLKGTPVIIKIAKWGNGHEEFRVETDEPSQDYKDWVIEICDGEDGPNTYSYDEGVAP